MVADSGSVGSRIRAARQRKRWHQITLAKMLGWSRQKMSLIENGGQHVKDDELRTLADVLDVSADELLGIRPGNPRPRGGLGEKQGLSWTPLRVYYHMAQVVLVGLCEPQYSMA